MPIDFSRPTMSVELWDAPPHGTVCGTFYAPDSEQHTQAQNLDNAQVEAGKAENAEKWEQIVNEQIGPFVRGLLCGLYLEDADGKQEAIEDWEQGADQGRVFTGWDAVTLLRSVCFRVVTKPSERFLATVSRLAERSGDTTETESGGASG